MDEKPDTIELKNYNYAPPKPIMAAVDKFFASSFSNLLGISVVGGVVSTVLKKGSFVEGFLRAAHSRFVWGCTVAIGVLGAVSTYISTKQSRDEYNTLLVENTHMKRQLGEAATVLTSISETLERGGGHGERIKAEKAEAAEAGPLLH